MDDCVASVTAAVAVYRRHNQKIKNTNHLALVLGLLDEEDAIVSRDHTCSLLSLSDHAIAYRWHSLPRVRRHRVSKPQGSSERVLPWHVTMDQFIRDSLSHTHY